MSSENGQRGLPNGDLPRFERQDKAAERARLLEELGFVIDQLDNRRRLGVPPVEVVMKTIRALRERLEWRS